jgi:putative endonuclease
MTNSLERRLKEHHEGVNSSCYTWARRPLMLKYSEAYQFVGDAIAREKQMKRWSRKKKEALINGDIEELKQLAKKRNA